MLDTCCIDIDKLMRENTDTDLTASQIYALKTLQFIRKAGRSQGKIIIISYRNLHIENTSPLSLSLPFAYEHMERSGHY